MDKIAVDISLMTYDEMRKKLAELNDSSDVIKLMNDKLLKMMSEHVVKIENELRIKRKQVEYLMNMLDNLPMI